MRLKEAVAQAEQLMDDPQAFIRAHMEFHALVVELAGNETLAVLNGMVRHIIELANWSHVDLDAGSPDNVRANKRGFRAHVRLVELVAARQSGEAEALWRLHLPGGRELPADEQVDDHGARSPRLTRLAPTARRV